MPRILRFMVGFVMLLALALPPGSAQMSGFAPGWSLTAPMGEARSGHTATRLKDGRVLVVGGSTAEIFDPLGEMWSPAGAPLENRVNPTATLLQDGRVLVVGGWVSGLPTQRVEIFDPSGGGWSLTGSLMRGRYDHTATLLQDGKVLIAGGYSGWWPGGTEASAEIYDPSSGTWAWAGSMSITRTNHTATLLQDGRVLVTGGLRYYSCLPQISDSAEIYDPASGTWSETAWMADSRMDHTATLLADGRVLVAGGAGYRDTPFEAEVFDSVTGTWSLAGQMGVARSHHTATLLADGSVLLGGGFSTGYTALSSAEIYHPGSGRWLAVGGLFSPRADHAAALLEDGRLLVTGGRDNSGDLTSAEIYTHQAPNTAPSFAPGADVTVSEDSAAYAAAWAAQISAGVLDEGGQSLTFQVTSDRPELFAVQPAISPEGVLTFTPAPGASGTAVQTVTLSDDGGTANGGVDSSEPVTFSITILESQPFQSYLPLVQC